MKFGSICNGKKIAGKYRGVSHEAYVSGTRAFFIFAATSRLIL